MKLFILVDDPTCYGGIQQFARNLAHLLSDKIQVVLLAYSGALSNFKECPYPIVRLCEAEKRGGWARQLRGGADVYIRPGVRKLAGMIADIPGIRRRMAQEMPGGDILMVNSIHSMHLFVPQSVMARNRVVFVQHNSPEQIKNWRYDFGGWLRPAKIAMFNRYADAMVMLSAYEQVHFEQYLNLTDKLTRAIRHETQLLPESELPVTRDRTVMFLGRLTRQKRVDRILEVARHAPEFHFNLYGDGPEEAALRSQARDLANVTFHGYIKSPQTAMQNNAIALFTSDFEGYPIAGIECVAYGKPLLGLNRFPAAVDLVEHGRNGLLFDSFDPVQFADALRELHRNHDSYRQGALQRRGLYAPETIRREWCDFLDALIQREARPK